MNFKTTISIFLISMSVFVSKAQNIPSEEEVNPLNGFYPLVNKTWFAQGNWENGNPFFQETTFKYALNKTLVIVDTKVFINPELTRFGNRSHGIRRYNTEKKQIEFTEYDVFGGITKGIVKIVGRDLWIQYDYDGQIITDLWEYKNDNTYNLIVGIYENEAWTKKYLETEFKRKK